MNRLICGTEMYTFHVALLKHSITSMIFSLLVPSISHLTTLYKFKHCNFLFPSDKKIQRCHHTMHLMFYRTGL